MAGTKSSFPAERWSTIVSRDRGWREIDATHSGLGFTRDRILFGARDLPDPIIRKHPDTVFVAVGHNAIITVADSADTIHAQIGTDCIAGASHWNPRHPERMTKGDLRRNNGGFAAITKQMDVVIGQAP